jgi:5'(3')-deoxyribonucleotidase
MKRKRPRALVDCDGVLSDFFDGARKIIKELCGRDYKFEEITNWDIFSIVPREIEKECFRRFARKDFCKNLNVLDGSQEGMKRLAEVADIYIVTSPMHTSRWVFERTNWLKKHFNIQSTHLISAHCKYVVEGELLIDDRAANTKKWAEHHPDGVGVIWAAPHNVNDKIEGNLIRTGSWDEVIELTKKMTREGT